MKLKTKFALFHCSRCKTSYNNPLGHVCVSNKTTKRKVTVKPKLTLSAGDCANCGKKLGNPLTHVCTNTGGFARRRAASKRQAKRDKGKAATAARREKTKQQIAQVRATERGRANRRVAAARAKGRRSKGPSKPRATHDYRSCPDKDCSRMTCEAWKEALEEGYEDGYAAGVLAGQSAAGRS